MANSAQENLMTAEEVAEYLGVPVKTLYHWRYQSEGPPSYKVGRHIRYRLQDLEEWLSSRRMSPGGRS